MTSLLSARARGAILMSLLALAAAGGVAHAATLEVRPALAVPTPPTMEAYPNPAMQLDVQLQAIRHADDGATQDVTLLATWSSSESSVGSVSASGLFEGSGPGETLVTASYGGLTSQPLRVRIGALNAVAVAQGPRVPPGPSTEQATTDPDLKAAMLAILELILGTPLTRAPFDSALARTDYHEEGVNAGGAPVSGGGLATTYLPGITFADWNIVVVYDGKYHTVFKAGDAAALRGRQFFDAGGLATGALQRAIHEMTHVLLRVLGIDIGSQDEEQLVSQVERLLTTILEIFHVPGRGQEDTWRNLLRTLYQDLVQKQGAGAVLSGLGIEDLDADGLPDLIEQAPIPALPRAAAVMLAVALASCGAMLLWNRSRRAMA